MTRKALIVGIDHYDTISSLSGCVNDAHSVRTVLERHSDGTLNFVGPKTMTAASPSQRVTKRDLKDAVRDLFADDAEIALFYFSGHGYIEDTGGFLCASDSADGDDGLSLHDVLYFANESKAKNKVVVLDSCHSGFAGTGPINQNVAEISEGLTILTASAADQYAMEEGGAGVFTGLFVDALNGAAANLMGDVTPGSVYAHVDQSLGPWAQRPVFKTNVKSFVSLRKADAPIAVELLRALTTHFPTPDHQIALNPSYEPERNNEQLADLELAPPDPINTATFAVLQGYVRCPAPTFWSTKCGALGRSRG
jgi:hypothetical protein